MVKGFEIECDACNGKGLTGPTVICDMCAGRGSVLSKEGVDLLELINLHLFQRGMAGDILKNAVEYRFQKYLRENKAQ